MNKSCDKCKPCSHGSKENMGPNPKKGIAIIISESKKKKRK